MKLWLKNTFYLWPGLLEMIIIYHGSHLQPRRDKALSSIVYSLFEKWFWRVYLRFQRLCHTDGKIFHRHWKIVAYWMVLLFVWLAKDDGNFHPRIFSHRLKFHRHFELQSYTWVFGNFEFIFGNLTKPLSILHFLILLKRCWKFSWLFWVRLKIFGIFPGSLLNCKTFCLKRMEIGTICIKKGIYHRTSPVHGNILKFHSR